MPIDPSLILGGAKLLGGLFGKKAPTPSDNIVSQARGARKAAELYGFSPLTMLQYGQPGGAMGGGGTPPLASAQLMLEGLSDVTDVLTGKTAQDAAERRFNLDRAKLQLEQARSGVVTYVPPNAAKSMGGTTTVGERPVSVGTPAVSSPTAPLSAGDNWLTPGRETKISPTENLPLIMEVENAATGGPINVLGSDGEVLGLSELAALGIQAIPQMANNWLGPDSKAGQYFGRIGAGVENAIVGPTKDKATDEARFRALEKKTGRLRPKWMETN